MLSNSINSALSGLAAFESKLYESAQNIANYPTQIDFSEFEYQSQTPDDTNIHETQQSDSISGTVGINPFYFSRISGSDLTTDTVNMMIAQRGYEANLNVLKTADDMTKSVIDILG